MALFKNRSRKTVTLLVAAGVTIAGTGVAFAYWTSTGAGEGNATTGQDIAFVVTSEAPAGLPLTPGSGVAQTVDFNVNNPSTGNQFLSQVTVRVANADGTPWTVPGVNGLPDCTADDYTVAITSTAPAVPTQVAPDGDVTGVATITMDNTATNQDTCQGVTVPLYFFAGTEPV